MVLWERNKLCFGEAILKLPVSSQLWREIEIGMLKKRWGELFVTGEKVLDLGCGEGEIAKELFEGKQLEWGLDNDSEMVEKAKKCGMYKKVMLASAESIPLPDNSVKLVFSNSVLEHIPGVRQVLSEVSRVLETGGSFVTTMPNNKLSEYLGWGKTYALWFNKKFNHYHLYNLRTWQKMFEKAGMKVEESYCYLDMGTIQKWHKLLWKQKLGMGLVDISKKKISLRDNPEGAAIAVWGRKI